MTDAHPDKQTNILTALFALTYISNETRKTIACGLLLISAEGISSVSSSGELPEVDVFINSRLLASLWCTQHIV